MYPASAHSREGGSGHTESSGQQGGRISGQQSGKIFGQQSGKISGQQLAGSDSTSTRPSPVRMTLRAGANAAFGQLPISPSINRILNRTGIFVLSQPGTQHKVSSLGELLLQVPCTRDFVAAAILMAATSCRRCKTNLALCNLDENLQFVLKAQLQKHRTCR